MLDNCPRINGDEEPLDHENVQLLVPLDYQVTRVVRNKLQLRKLNKGFDLQEIPLEPHMLKMPIVCPHCGAKKFEYESKGFCCSKGDIVLKMNDVPAALYELFMSSSDEAREFKRFVRVYNSNFAFTSFGVKYDKDLCNMKKGLYTFRIQGQIYHYINDLVPVGCPPSFLQLYFHDTEHELENRLNFSDNMTSSIINKISDVLNVNPYCQFFRSLRDVPELKSHKIEIKTDSGLDQRVYNAPSVSQVAAIWVNGDFPDEHNPRDIIVSCHSGTNHRIQYYFGCYDPLQYPLLFPYGQTGWHQGLEKKGKKRGRVCSKNEDVIDAHRIGSITELISNENTVLKGKKKRHAVSCREYYCYKLQIRLQQRSILLHAGRLLQQYVVDMYVKIETSRLDYFRKNQGEIRAELYRGIIDSIECGETRGCNVGKRIVLPSSFIGGPRDMKKRYMNAMALVQRYGKPDLFLTITCNPNWPEIKGELRGNDEVQNRPDLVSRVFRAKLEELKNDLFKKQIFGPVVAYVYVIEFQKRGLPHAHFLIILRSSSKIVGPESFDKIVSAEIPDLEEFSYLHSLVVKHMLHGPCGVLNPENVCMQNDGQCKSHYPKPFRSETQHGQDSYPKYRRRDDGRKVKVRGHYLDNRWVIPYNPYLLAKFDCHINVEICSTIKAVKYLYKYIYKGHDRISFSVASDNGEEVDEIKMFQSARWVSPPEAAWRIYGFILNEVYPSVIPLQLHLEDSQLVTFRKTDDLNRIANNDRCTKSMLTEYFQMNCSNELAKKLLYKEFPEYFVWDTQSRTWASRKQGGVIGRIVAASPTEGERYYLRLLLNHVRGATSFDDLKIVNRVSVSSYREAAVLHGLLNGDNNFELCLEEVSLYQMPFEMRRLFATILVLCAPDDPRMLWGKFKEFMCEDYSHKNNSRSCAELKALQSLNSIMETMGKNVNDYGLVDFTVDVDPHEETTRLIDEELLVPIPDDDLLSLEKLNSEQKLAFDMILTKVFTNEEGAFFIDGPGGIGKTFLYRALLATVRSKKLLALAVASSGVAAAILPGGRTAHSRFKIPLQLDDNATCGISKQSALAKLLKLAKLIIWDEAPMVHRQAIEALDRLLQDVNDCGSQFGGKVVVLGGDFRQVLPVISKGTKADVLKASLVNSYLWKTFTKINLVQNMRTRLDSAFAEYLLRLGDGEEECDSSGQVRLPSDMIIPYEEDSSSLRQLIEIVFPNLAIYPENWKSMIDRVILTTKNDYVDQINNLLLEQFPGDAVKYYSFDEVVDTAEQSIQEDFLNTLSPNGIPPHELTLKVNCPVMLLRNINPAEGLCNGTRLICRRFERNVIDAEIVIGEHRGKRVFLPRIPFIPLEDNKNPFPFKRTQFPLRPCFAMTINKAQGQTLEFIGLYLPEPVFSHGQLYVALSRAKTSASVKILIKPSFATCSNFTCTKNVVYKEILSAVNSVVHEGD